MNLSELRLAVGGPVQLLGLEDDADIYVNAASVVPAGTGDRTWERVTLGCGTTYARWQEGCSETVAWVQVPNVRRARNWIFCTTPKKPDRVDTTWLDKLITLLDESDQLDGRLAS